MFTQLLSFVALSLRAGCPDPIAIATSPALQRAIADEGAIISAAIEGLYTTSAHSPFVVQAVNQQIIEPIGVDFRSHVAGVAGGGGPILDDYLRRNSASCDLGPMLAESALSANVALVTDDALASLRQGTLEDFWRAFNVRFPGSGGLITVARPGIDPSGSRALLYIGRDCGVLCVTGGYAWMKKQNAGWRVERYVAVISS